MEIQDINIKTNENRITAGEQLVLLEGTHAVALAVALCRVKVIAAYPITPSSSIAEKPPSPRHPSVINIFVP